MAYPTRDDLTYDKGNKGYGTMASLPEPTEGSAGDLAAEAATAGIVNTDASAELAAQVPNIVVPVNQSSDSDSDSNSDPYTYKGEFDPNDEATIYADERTGIESQIDLGDISRIASNPTNSAAMNRAIKIAINTATGGITTLPFLLNDQYQKRETAKRQAIVDEAETARLADTPENLGGQIDFETGEITGSRTGDVNIYDEVALTGGSTDDSTPTYTMPSYVYEDNSSDSQSDSQSDASASQSADDEAAGAGGYAVGGIVRVRKNKQNNRIHERRKRLAMGGITSLYG